MEYSGRLLVVRLTRVSSSVLKPNAMYGQFEDAALATEVVLLTGEDLDLVLVPADGGIGLVELTVHVHDDILLLAVAVRQLLDPVVLGL